MRDGLGIALACNDLDWTRVWQVARRNCTVGRMVGVAAIGDAWLYGTPRWVLAQTRQEACDRLETTVMRPSGTRENKQTNISKIDFFSFKKNGNKTEICLFSHYPRVT
jgi:hypothetical protein